MVYLENLACLLSHVPLRVPSGLGEVPTGMCKPGPRVRERQVRSPTSGCPVPNPSSPGDWGTVAASGQEPRKTSVLSIAILNPLLWGPQFICSTYTGSRNFTLENLIA